LSDIFDNVPDISFVNKDVETLLSEMISEYEQAYLQQTGETKTLAQGDPVRIFIYSQALRIYAAYQLIDYSAKQNLLKYAEGDYLDNIGVRIGALRLQASSAISKVRFTLSATQINTVPIPKGTRVSTSTSIFFATEEYAEILPGDLYADVNIQCSISGSIGNGFTSGQINVLVDPIGFIQSVSNITTSQGGTDIESDEAFRNRIVIKPESFSVAGPSGAYEYFAKQYNQSIIDVMVSSPLPGQVDVRFILENGEIPNETLLTEVESYLSNKTRRPLTDQVIVGAPNQVSYDIDVTYYIRKSDVVLISDIQVAIENAKSEFIIWQKSKISRSINPDELLYRLINAGAKRVVINEPQYYALLETQVAIENNINFVYGGVEDD
jgi:phage-related baseplate assembly protein